jgi:hypothetical protein
METISVPTWIQLLMSVPPIMMLVVVLAFLIKVAPTWKEIQLKKLSNASEENTVKGQIAAALIAVAASLENVAKTTKEIAIEQRKATEIVEILQRVNADSADTLSQSVAVLSDRVNRLEQLGLRNDQPEGTAKRTH